MHDIFDIIENRGDDTFLEGVLAKGATTIFYGKAGCGKSFLAIDIGMHVVNGKDWHGLKTRKGKVLYFCGEGVMAFAQRIAAWNDRYSAGLTRDFQAYLEPRLLSDIDIVRRIVKESAEDQFVPDLLIVDTFARSFSGNENSAQDVGAFISNIYKLQGALGDCAVLIVHHSGKSEVAGPRGSSALFSAADTVYLVAKDDDSGGLITVKNEKARNSEPRAFTFRLERQDTTMRFKEDGAVIVKDVKSAVPVMVDEPAWKPAALKEKDTELSKAQKFLVELLEQNGGRMLSTAIFEEAKSAGITEKTIRRARDILSISYKRAEGNAYAWELPKTTL